MAWRIDEHVVRGELDNRQKGAVRGRIWLAGSEQPLELELTGNACPDLAGCLLQFANPKPVPLPPGMTMAPEQRGRIGDLTASRKVRVFDVPLTAAKAMMDRGETPPEHKANCLYLEWFSERNGRVVIESAAYQLEISAPEWRLSPAEEQQRLADAAAGWGEFLGRLDAAIQQQQRGAKDPETSWDEHDYERLLKESDARTDKYGELLEKYGHTPEAEPLIAKEMGWDQEPAAGEDDADWDIDAINAACAEALEAEEPEPDPAREGIDWIRTADGRLCHPLQHRCLEAVRRWQRTARQLGLDLFADEDLAQFIGEFQITAAKLAGALNCYARGTPPQEAAFTVAYLKRALDHLHKAQAGLETAAGQGKFPEPHLSQTRAELFAIREQILALMQQYRQQP